MFEEVAVLPDEQKTMLFKQDTALLGKSTADFVQNFYPAYGIDKETISSLPKENSLELLNSCIFYRLSECTVDNIDELFPFFCQ